jgi:hypothetical protein
MTDPLHAEILGRLGGELDPRVFEDCACDLLRAIYPSLVCVRGGQDSGMDGAIADDEGEAFPLICTTGADVKRNLVESLDSYVERGLRRRRAVFATSRSVTPEQRFRLEAAAREKGFVLVQVVERHGMARLLYENPHWLKKLLGLSARPSALSARPQSRRPLLDIEPVGREEDLAWLRSTPGDLVLSGEPGSGKTFLVTHLVRSGWGGLFLVDDDRGETKEALLHQRPSAVMVDDAHLRIATLTMLRHLREEMGADFAIVALSWTWEKDVAAVTAALPGVQQRELRLLPRHQILEIFQQAGVQGSDDLLRELVDQAANKPGLAATIAHLWKRGAWQEILEGKALHRDVLTSFGTMGEDIEDLLATFSLGGDRGMGLEAVGRFLGIARPEIRRKAAALAAGGVLREESEGALSVWPRQLRTSLLRTVFFADSGARLEHQPLIDGLAEGFSRAVREIAEVRLTGARIPGLHDLVLRVGCGDESAKAAWRSLAAASESEARWVLEHYPGDLLDVAAALLERIPDEVIPHLLERACEEAHAKARESQAMSSLSSWIQAPQPSEAVHRRWQVARAAQRFLQNGGDLDTGVHGICLALHPGWRWSTRDPGLGNTVTLRSALLPIEDLRRIVEIWEDVHGSIPGLDRAAWQHLATALWEWMHPDYAARGATVPDDVAREMPEFASRLLHDLIPLAESSPGLRARLAQLAAQIDASLPIEQDPVFELLYPESYVETEPDREAARMEALQRLAGEWARLGPSEMAQRLARYEAEADLIGYSWPRGSQDLCRFLAREVEDPRSWIAALEEQHLASNFLSPFLERFIEERGSGWDELADQLLDRDLYQFSAAQAVLKGTDVPPVLVQKALDIAVGWPLAVETLALRREMPIETLHAALRHPCWKISLAAAVGEWHHEKSAREVVRAEWREAILRAPSGGLQVGVQYWLGVILARDADLALDWLRARLKDPDLPGSFSNGPFALAVQALRPEQRSELLGELPAISLLRSLLPRLVGRDVVMYRRLLEQHHLRDYHLAPLHGKPDEAWAELAQLARAAGFLPRQIAEATAWGSGGHSWSLPGVDYWTSWDEAFAAFESHSSADIQEIARTGREVIAPSLRRAVKEQQQISLHGF